MKKHQQKNGSKKRRWFPRRKPHGMTDAQVVGTMSAIDKRERHEKRVEIRRLKQGMEAMEREQYHTLRQIEANRQHNSTMQTNTRQKAFDASQRAVFNFEKKML